MRTLLPLLLFVVIGCNHCARFMDCSSCSKEARECVNEVSDQKPKRVSKNDCVVEQPCPKPAPQRCEQAPEIEIKAPKPIHIKMPPQQYIIENGMQQQAMAYGQQQAMMQPQSFAPQSFAPQSFAPQAAAPQQVMMMPVMQPQSAGPAGRARPGLTLDFFRLPIPFPRLIAVPEAAPQMQAVAMVMPQSFAPQSFAPQSFAPQSFAPQSFAPQSFAPQSFAPQAAPQQHVMVPVPGTVDVPVQTMMKVPYQAHVPVPVQPQSFVPQSMAVQPQAMIGVPQATAGFRPQSAVQPQMQGITLQQAEEFCRMVEQMKKQANERK
jgi:hypothetical protein